MANVSLATKLGMHSEATPSSQNTDSEIEDPDGPRAWPIVDNGKDYFIERNGVKYAGMHLLIDLWGATNLDNLEIVEKALTTSAEVAGATLLHAHLHHFSPNGGISGVLVLAESHISIHTWPEKGYAALDVFMCGECDPHKTIPVLRDAFKPTNIVLGEQKRGLIP